MLVNDKNPMDRILHSEDGRINYWVAWMTADNPNGWHGDKGKYRLFADDLGKKKATPISDAVSKEEALALYDQLELLIKGT